MDSAPFRTLAESTAWVDRCAARLRRQWPTLAQQDLDDAARQLWSDDHWRSMPPEQAAIEWLRLGAIE